MVEEVHAPGPPVLSRRRLLVAGGAAVGALVVTAGCTHQVALRDGMRDNYPFAPQDPQVEGLADLQVFTSRRIMLRRRLRSGEKSVAGGKIVSRKGKLVEETVVWARTPGVIVDAGDDWLDVSFARGTSMRFRRAATEGDHRIYRLAYEADRKGRPIVPFQGRMWRPMDRSDKAVLMVRREAHGNMKWRRTRLRGMRVGET